MARSVGAVAVHLNGVTRDFERKFATANATLNRFGNRVRKAGTAMAAFGKRATLAITLPLAAITAAGLKFAATIETQRVAFATLLGDVEKGTKLFEDLKRFSAETPLQLDDIVKGTQTLLAFGIAQENVIMRMRMLGDAAMGNSARLASLVRAYGKVRAKGKATLEELNLFTENGVGILDQMAKQMDITTEALLDLVTKGKIGFKDVSRALEAMTGPGGQFANMMEKISKTTMGRFSTAVDNTKLALAGLLESLLPTLNKALLRITELAQKFATLDDEQKMSILRWAAIAAAAGPVLFLFGNMVKTVGLLVTGLSGMSKVIMTRLIPALVKLRAVQIASLGGVTGILAAGVGGFAVGTALDRALGISDRISKGLVQQFGTTLAEGEEIVATATLARMQRLQEEANAAAAALKDVKKVPEPEKVVEDPAITKARLKVGETEARIAFDRAKTEEKINMLLIKRDALKQQIMEADELRALALKNQALLVEETLLNLKDQLKGEREAAAKRLEGPAAGVRFAAAVEKGTVEAHRAEARSRQSMNKVETNTQATADNTAQIASKIDDAVTLLDEKAATVVTIPG